MESGPAVSGGTVHSGPGDQLSSRGTAIGMSTADEVVTSVEAETGAPTDRLPEANAGADAAAGVADDDPVKGVVVVAIAT